MATDKEIKEALQVDFDNSSAKKIEVTRRRLERIQEAISWSSGPNPDEKITHNIWTGRGYVVRLGKPGKETLEHDSSGQVKNENDMLPMICVEGGERCTKNASFHDINNEFLSLYKHHTRPLVLLACLLFRDAFLLDHVNVNGHWRYAPPRVVVNRIEDYVSAIFGVPVEVFLQYIDALAWNEDVKYFTRGYWDKQYGTNVGQPNTLLSAVSTISFLTGRVDFIDFIRPLIQRAVRPISKSKAQDLFPLLKGEDDFDNV